MVGPDKEPTATFNKVYAVAYFFRRGAMVVGPDIGVRGL